MDRWEKLEEELESAKRAVDIDAEPTEEEKRNGWTKKTLTEYLKERNAVQTLTIDIKSLHRKVLPDVQNHNYRVRRWRG